jgi:hypothetical protein
MTVILVWPLVAFVADTTIKARRARMYSTDEGTPSAPAP